MKCSFCSKTCNSYQRVRKHIRLVHPEKWRSGQGLLEKEVHHYTYRYKCPACEKLFKKLHLFQLHWREAHSKDIKNSSCTNLSIEIIAIPRNLESVIQSQKIRSILVEESAKKFARIEVPLLEPEQEVRICKVETCQRPFYSEKDFESHSKLHGSFKCGKCPVRKDFLPDLAAHEFNAHEKSQRESVKYQRCPETFIEFSSYLRHHASAHFSLEFNENSCPICNTYLQRFERERQSFKLFKHFKKSHDLDSELEKQSKGTELHRCTEEGCSAYFMSLTGLNYHRKSYHQLGKEEIEELKKARDVRVCEECGKRFKDQIKLDQHRRSHMGLESFPFCCEFCLKKCPTRQKLNEHLRTHTKEKPFVCEVCGAKYAHSHNLRIHIKNKHGEGAPNNSETVGNNDTLISREKKEKKQTTKGNDKRRKRRRKEISEESMTESEDLGN